MNLIADQMQFRKFRIEWFVRIYSSSFRDSLSKHVCCCCCHKYSTFSNNSNPEILQKAGSRSPQNDDELSQIISSNKKITSHIRSGNINSAMEVFENMNTKTTVTWNSILSGLANLPGKVKEARELFDKIPEPDTVSYNAMLACYFKNAAVGEAKAFFQMIPVKDVASWNTMISGLFRTARIDEAEELFHIMPRRNIVTWNIMISGYVEAGVMESALKLFEKAPSKSVVTWTSLISGYMRSGNVDLAEKTFKEMPDKNLVTWNAMIAGYVENGRGETALKLFKKMLELGSIGPNHSTLSSVLLACSNLCLLKFGKQVHQLTCKSPLCIDTTVGNSLISMYSKCGVLNDSHKLFTDMPCKDVTTFNAMISGYAQHGESEKALDLFDEMASDGRMIKPDWITFVGVLSACNHAGLVDLGIHYFERMQRDYEIKPKPDHYTCMIDLLGRAGKLNDAMDMIEKMPCKPHAALYGTLLGACRTHKNVEIAVIAARKLLGINSCNPAAYVQLANVYASKKKWEKVSEIRRSMKQNKLVKTPGISWIEVKGMIHEFRSRDRRHPELKRIHEKLDELEKKLKLAGYVPVLESSLHDVADEQKQELLLCHSEKLAIAFGLTKLPSDIPIRVFKNLRVCEDCHEATKFISAVEGRELVVRDTTRFHHFKEGRCSCGDYW